MRPQECNNCYFSTGDGKEWEPKKGEWPFGKEIKCRRFPPVFVELTVDDDGNTGHYYSNPTVCAADWCGEWKEDVSIDTVPHYYGPRCGS